MWKMCWQGCVQGFGVNMESDYNLDLEMNPVAKEYKEERKH